MGTEHRGGYRDAACAVVDARDTTHVVLDGRPGLARLHDAVVIELVAGLCGSAMVAVVVWLVVRVSAPTMPALASMVAIALELSAGWALVRRLILVHRERPTQVSGSLDVRGTRWRFVTDAGDVFHVRPDLIDPTTARRAGPTIALIHRRLGVVVAHEPLLVAEEEETRLIQRGLDAHFGVSSAERDELSRGDLPASLRGRALRRAILWTLPLVSAVAALVVGLIARDADVVMPAILLVIVAAMPAGSEIASWRMVFARHAVEVVGQAYASIILGFSSKEGRRPAIRIGYEIFESTCMERRLLEGGDRVRVFVTPREKAVVAIEHIGRYHCPPVTFHHLFQAEYEPVLASVRAQFH